MRDTGASVNTTYHRDAIARDRRDSQLFVLNTDRVTNHQVCRVGNGQQRVRGIDPATSHRGRRDGQRADARNRDCLLVGSTPIQNNVRQIAEDIGIHDIQLRFTTV